MIRPTDNDIPWDDLTAWLAGTLPAEEAVRLQAWIAEDASRKEFVRSLRLIWEGAAAVRPGHERQWDARAAIAAIKAREAGRPKVLPMPGAVMPPLSARPRRLALIAAAGAGLLIGGWMIATSGVGRVGGGLSVAETQAGRRHETTRGQRLAFRLPDGSGVVLGPESSIRYAPSYGEHSRVVELEGDALFQVAHDAARPFEVRTAHAIVRDLGTRFVVRARRNASDVEVAVAEGRAALGRPDTSRAVSHTMASPTPVADSVVLMPGDWGRATSTGALARRRGVALDRYFGWTEGRLVFDAADLTDVVAELNRWYDVDIRLADSAVGRLRLTATFHDQPVTEVLSSIQASLRLELSGAGHHFTLAAP